MIRNDNSIVLEHVHSINSVTKGRILSGPIHSNREELGNSHWLAFSHIGGSLNTPDELGNENIDPDFFDFVISPKHLSGGSWEERECDKGNISIG